VLVAWRLTLAISKHQQHHIGLRREWGGQRSPFGIAQTDRRQHLYVIGKTGVGKSTLLKSLILADIAAGRGVGLLDPHGDLASEILDYIPRSRLGDVVIFDASDLEHPVGFNALKPVPRDMRPLVASSIVASLKAIWRDSWGPRLEYVLYACVAALMECQNVTLLSIQRMLVDEKYLNWVVAQVKDPVVLNYWSGEFAQFNDRQIAEIISPLQNKVGQLLMSPVLRNIFGQVSSKLDARFMMDNQRIFIANLSKGALGADKSNLLGALLVSHFEHAAMQRGDMPENERKDFNLYIDEFQNFATDSFAAILSEARKYRLCLTLSHQYTAQLPETLKDAVFGNVGNMVSFRVNEQDAQTLEREFDGEVKAHEFTALENHHICVKLFANGSLAAPFKGQTIPPDFKRTDRRETLIKLSRQKFCQPRHRVEFKIKKWMGVRE
jgi:energy-coupling factor transporter ATP-binding protein EcfA2